MNEPDPFDLGRFLRAQDGSFDAALAEIRAGRKASHWMWFVFPQLRGLGSSPMAQRYAIGSLAEARAYLDHPVLGPRLAIITEAVIDHADTPLRALFGTPDDLKYRSSMTLFALARQEPARPEGAALWRRALAVHCRGEECPRTLALLATRPPA
ncbi:DUF1810 domain-containing protein [Ancylobacter sp. 6x-1]|uniref:DUF1810 domain-containing protein n=1 Tax=Ancylobacter crimeensis TaxID=2579147 RepID=A0ABT0DAH0_9HYPH|nr:DUF1810 domain-containing protein [Ancylobacter crimeensis]MCK0196943.1 DUF1810 domain-containing protein [Ancylobacter crimeensis]